MKQIIWIWFRILLKTTNMNKLKIASALFLVVSIVYVFGIIFEISSLILLKPFILLLLISMYLVSTSNLNYTYLLALGFSLLGDVMLMFSSELYFIVGLLFFLVAHQLYIRIVLKRVNKVSLKTVVFSSLPFVIGYMLLLFFLKEFLSSMLIPVIIYGFVISSFGSIALVAYFNKKTNQSIFMLIGAIVFILSDSILAINKFYFSTLYFKVLVMITYIIAQYLIYKSMVIKSTDVYK